MGDYSFPKSNRLTGKKKIDRLFGQGKTFVRFPFRVIYLNAEGPAYQAMFSVPSRQFKNATDRNRIRRQMREAFRHEQAPLRSVTPLMIVYIYIAKEILPGKEIREKMAQAIAFLIRQC
ncbi:MAG: ribonuclease P protein component [Bacteroidetes bacterium]|nr:ribonuclease P protein component [Bacteroidota bacterium]